MKMIRLDQDTIIDPSGIKAIRAVKRQDLGDMFFGPRVVIDYEVGGKKNYIVLDFDTIEEARNRVGEIWEEMKMMS